MHSYSGGSWRIYVVLPANPFLKKIYYFPLFKNGRKIIHSPRALFNVNLPGRFTNLLPKACKVLISIQNSFFSYRKLGVESAFRKFLNFQSWVIGGKLLSEILVEEMNPIVLAKCELEYRVWSVKIPTQETEWRFLNGVVLQKWNSAILDFDGRKKVIFMERKWLWTARRVVADSRFWILGTIRIPLWGTISLLFYSKIPSHAECYTRLFAGLLRTHKKPLRLKFCLLWWLFIQCPSDECRKILAWFCWM